MFRPPPSIVCVTGSEHTTADKSGRELTPDSACKLPEISRIDPVYEIELPAPVRASVNASVVAFAHHGVSR